MCDCANCDEVTLFSGEDGNGIVDTSFDSETGELTLTYTDGTTYTTTSLIGPAGANGAPGPQGPAGICECEPVLYVQERLGTNTSGTAPAFTILTNMTYTVPAGQAGLYELLFVSDAQFVFGTSGSAQINVDIFKNSTPVSAITQKRVKMTGLGEQEYIIPISVMASNINLSVGDVITVRSNSTSPASAYLNFGVMKLNKL